MRFVREAVVGAICLTVAACGSLLPSGKPAADPNWVWHIENRVSQALLIQVDVSNQSDGDTYFTGLRPCSDTTLTFGDELPVVPNIDHWQTLLFVDPTGAFDRALADWQGDPHDMTGTFPGLTTVVYADGTVELSSLPKWLTVGSAGATVGGQPTPMPDACPSLDDSNLHPSG